MRCPKGAWIITTHEHPIQCLDRPAPCFVDPATVVVSFGRSARRGTCSTWRERRRRVLSRLAPWRRFVGLSERRTKFGLDAGDVGMGIALSRVEREAGRVSSELAFVSGWMRMSRPHRRSYLEVGCGSIVYVRFGSISNDVEARRLSSRR